MNFKITFQAGVLPRKYIAVLGQKGIKFNEFQKACDTGLALLEEGTPVVCSFFVKKDGSCKLVKYSLGFVQYLPPRALDTYQFPVKWLYAFASAGGRLSEKEIQARIRKLLGFLKSSKYRVVWD